MSFLPSPQLEELRSRLSQVTDAIFDRSARLPSSNFGPTISSLSTNGRILTLCRGPGRADSVLQQLGHQWPSLSEENQTKLRDDWDIALAALLRELGKQCTTCPAGVADCNHCRYMVPTVSERLERLAEEITQKLEVERTPPPPTPTPTPTPTPVPEAAAPPAEDKEHVPEVNRELKESLEKTTAELASLTTVCSELNKDLDAARGDIEVVREERKSAREALAVALNQLDKAASNIEWYARDLEAGKRWKVAAEAYNDLRKMKDAKIGRLDGGALSDDEKTKARKEAILLRHKQVSALMSFGTYPDPELLKIAEELWEDVGAKGWWGQEGKLLFLPTSKELRKIHEDYCTILRGNKRYEDAERECMFVWYLPDWWVGRDSKDDWRYDTAYRIAGIMNEKKNYDEAIVWHRKVVQWALEMSPKRTKRAARSGAKLISLLETLNRSDGLVECLEPIWNAREADNTGDDILTCGFELGSRFLSKRVERAAPILKGVWEGMKATNNKRAIDAAELLAKAYGSLERDEELEALYPWIIENLPDDKKLERNKYRYALGYVQFTREKEEAEDTLRKAWMELEEDSRYGKDHRDTLQCGLLLGQVLVKKGSLVEAQIFLKEAWDGRQRYPNTTLIVRAGEFYGDALSMTGDPKDMDAAERVLDEVWRIASKMSLNNFVRDRNSVLWPALLSAGDCYGRLLLDRQKAVEAEKVLSKVVKLKKDLHHYEDIEETQHLVEEAKKMQLPPPPPLPNEGPSQGGMPGGMPPNLEPPKPVRPRSRSRRREPRKRPGFLSDVAWWMMTT